MPLAAALAPAALAQQSSGSAPAGDPIRVGIIGAGGIVSSVHVPGLKRQPGVELVAVANRSLESSQRAAAELGIANAYANWEELLAAGGLDAVLIGTWPYMHRTITLAALDEGLHVLCQARMANNTAEAREMLAASPATRISSASSCRRRAAIASTGRCSACSRERYVGDVLSVEVQMLQRGFASFDGELDWRHDPEFSGVNVLNVGGTYESAMRWLGVGNNVMAKTRVHVPTRRDEQGRARTATIPDHVEVLYELGNGAPVHMKFSETTGLSRGNQIWIFGSEGTIYVDNEQKIFGGRPRRSGAHGAAEPARATGRFIASRKNSSNAIRGREQIS